jgi:hypothetical protein
MTLSSSRSLFITILCLSGLIVEAFSSITAGMPPNSPASHKRRRVALAVGSIDNADDSVRIGKLEELKQKEIELSNLLAQVRREKMSELRAKPLKIGTFVVRPRRRPMVQSHRVAHTPVS